jgi:hypothetical protein
MYDDITKYEFDPFKRAFLRALQRVPSSEVLLPSRRWANNASKDYTSLSLFSFLHFRPSLLVYTCKCFSVYISPSDHLIVLTASRPLPDQQPRQSVANLIGRFEQQ